MDYGTVFQIAELFDIDMSPCMFSKLQALERYTVKNQGTGNRDQGPGKED